MIRLAHLSDIHVSAPQLEWQIQDYLNKRFAGWINFRWLGRRFRFRHSIRIVRTLFAELRERELDCVVFSGDATALGFESELRLAAELMGVDDPDMPTGLAVPGNHDYATRAAAASGLFERYFQPWQKGERVGNAVYPFARKIGNYWLIGVNSSSGNRWAWDATGRVGRQQTQRLRELLSKLGPGHRVLVTHYPVCLGDGRGERRWRKLRDLEELIQVASDGGIALWLHGHRHKGYYIPKDTVTPFPVICAGSATQSRLWSYCEYTLNGASCKVARRCFDPRTGAFETIDEFDVALRSAEHSGVLTS